MARPKEKETVMTKQGKRTYRLRKDGKKNTWRPYAIDESKIQELEAMFQYDVNIDDACDFVGISPTTFYAERDRNPKFAERMAKAKAFLKVTAWKTIAKAIRDWDVQTAKWFRERRDEDYRQKTTQISMTQWADPETWQQTQWLMVEFTLKE